MRRDSNLVVWELPRNELFKAAIVALQPILRLFRSVLILMISYTEPLLRHLGPRELEIEKVALLGLASLNLRFCFAIRLLELQQVRAVRSIVGANNPAPFAHGRVLEPLHHYFSVLGSDVCCCVIHIHLSSGYSSSELLPGRLLQAELAEEGVLFEVVHF